MERRLLKDFQIGLVEGIVSDAIKDKQPKDVFSRIAKAIGKRSGSKGKKDWNALVRRNTLKKDPIGSTNEAYNRQSLRRHILENQSSALSAMDPQKLIEYNPKLSTVSPAARVAYAKFKIQKIKQEFDNKEQGIESETTSCKGAEDVFEDQVASVTDVKETDSIVRPRPKSSLKQLSMAPGKLPSQSDEGQPDQASSGSSRPSLQKEFRPRTPIQEDPREDMTSPEPSTPVSSASTKDKSPAKKSDTTGSSTTENDKSPAKTPDTKPEAAASSSGTSKGDETKQQDTKKEEEKVEPQKTKKEEMETSKETEEKQKESKKEDIKPPDPSPRKPIQPSKPGGKSIVTGEILQGWL